MPESAAISNGIYLNGKGVFSDGNRVLLFYTPFHHAGKIFQIDQTHDGQNFYNLAKNCEIRDKKGEIIDVSKCRDFRITAFSRRFYLTFRLDSKDNFLYTAFSSDLIHYTLSGNISDNQAFSGMIVPKLKYKGKYILYLGKDGFKLSFSRDLSNWSLGGGLFYKLVDYHKNYSNLKIADISQTPSGILIIYALRENQNDYLYTLEAALFDKRDPTKLVYRLPQPIWETPDEWKDKNVNFIGLAVVKGNMFSYWECEGEGIYTVGHSFIPDLLSKKPAFLPSFNLNKLKENPILKPILSHVWESKATFNPAAVYENGMVHLIYRAIGDRDTSVLGYASSSDGTHIDQRLDEPIFVPNLPMGYDPGGEFYNPSPYMSGGGGYGGCEDPRITRLGDKFYMTYVAYDGWSPPRVALTSINADDFLNQRWNWGKAMLISPPGVVDKNACLLGEKVGGKYVMFHRIFPNILIDFVDDLSFGGKTPWLKGEFTIGPRRNYWDSRKVGVGPPPLKTSEGWLLIYHAVDDRDAGKYKIGAMLLDLGDPTKVLCRSNQPILEPTERYENEGYKGGVAYPCGAVTMDNELIVYYGGADTVVCSARANLPIFIQQLKYNEVARLTPVSVKPRYN